MASEHLSVRSPRNGCIHSLRLIRTQPTAALVYISSHCSFHCLQGFTTCDRLRQSVLEHSYHSVLSQNHLLELIPLGPPHRKKWVGGRLAKPMYRPFTNWKCKTKLEMRGAWLLHLSPRSKNAHFSDSDHVVQCFVVCSTHGCFWGGGVDVQLHRMHCGSSNHRWPHTTWRW